MLYECMMFIISVSTKTGWLLWNIMESKDVKVLISLTHNPQPTTNADMSMSLHGWYELIVSPTQKKFMLTHIRWWESVWSSPDQPITGQPPGWEAGGGGSTLIFDVKVEAALSSALLVEEMMMLSSALQYHQLRPKAPERFSKCSRAFSKVAPTTSSPPPDIRLKIIQARLSVQ